MMVADSTRAKVMKIAYKIAKKQFKKEITTEKVLIIYDKLIAKL